jgi:uncharacterized damage-inducible protein DinB
MNDVQMFLNLWQREFATTLKILKQMPADKADYKPPVEKTKSAKNLAEMFVAELGVTEGCLKGHVDLGGAMPTYDSYGAVLEAYEKAFKALEPKVKAMSQADWDSPIPFPVGPKQMGQMKKGDILWLMLLDSIHHRGQFSIYLRLVGAKVPSIYGPSGDEPWM